MNYDVIIIGAGPIGLMAANLLGKAEIKTLLIEKKADQEINSKAIGITPPSLEILNRINLDKEFIQNGVKVEKVFVHGTKFLLGNTSFVDIKSNYPFILAIPQVSTEMLLEKNLKNFKSVDFFREKEFIRIIKQNNDYLSIDVRDLKKIKMKNIKQNSCLLAMGKKAQ